MTGFVVQGHINKVCVTSGLTTECPQQHISNYQCVIIRLSFLLRRDTHTHTHSHTHTLTLRSPFSKSDSISESLLSACTWYSVWLRSCSSSMMHSFSICSCILNSLNVARSDCRNERKSLLLEKLVLDSCGRKHTKQSNEIWHNNNPEHLSYLFQLLTGCRFVYSRDRLIYKSEGFWPFWGYDIEILCMTRKWL